MLNPLFWRKYFEVYDYLNFLIPYHDLLNNIAKELKIINGDKILDVGSGTGNLSVICSRLGGEVTGIDSSHEGIRLHRKKQPSIAIYNQDITNKLPFPDNYFHKVCTNNTIYTIPKNKRLQVLKEFYRILRPGGVIVISNLTTGFHPMSIYIDHIKLSLEKYGIMATMKNILELLLPTLRIFYYNYLIKKENNLGEYSFMEMDEQSKLLALAGFSNISLPQKVYSNQAVLNTANK